MDAIRRSAYCEDIWQSLKIPDFKGLCNQPFVADVASVDFE